MCIRDSVQSLKLASTANTTMDDLQLYAGVLNDGEIAALAANPALPVPEAAASCPAPPCLHSPGRHSAQRHLQLARSRGSLPG